MFKKLMVPVDFDEGRIAFLKCLGGLKEFGAEEAVVAFCVDVPDLAGVRASLKDILGGELEALGEIVAQSGIKPHSEILIGPPSTTLADAADRLGAPDRRGSRSARFGDKIMGSAAHTAMCHARLPCCPAPVRGREGNGCKNWPAALDKSCFQPTSRQCREALRTVKRLVTVRRHA